MRILIILIAVLLALTTYGQDVAFVAIDVSGEVKKSDNKKVQIGTTLTNNEAVIVAGGGSVTFACQNSGYAHLNKPGRYLLSTTTYCRAAPSAAIAKLCSFAWKQITHHEAHDEWRNHLDNMGAASRGGCGVTIDRNIADIKYYAHDFVLMANPKNPGKKLYLNLYKNENTAAFLRIPLNDNRIGLPRLREKLSTGVYLWNIAPDGTNCSEYYTLEIVSKKTRDSVVTSYSKELGSYISNPAEKQYMLGYLLENLHYFADAYNCYTEAAKLGATETRYKEGLSDFKKRYGIQ